MNPSAFYDVAQAALDCVCSQMDALTDADGVPDGYGCPCSSYVSAGLPAIDCCVSDCDEPSGQLTVHIENVFPSDNFPIQTGTYEPCKAQTWVVELVVTAARCAPTIDEQGNPAPPDQLSANALLMAVDQYAIMTALSCCLVDDPPPGKRKRRVQVTSSTPLATEGGCSAVEIRALVEAGSICACAEGS